MAKNRNTATTGEPTGATLDGAQENTGGVDGSDGSVNTTTDTPPEETDSVRARGRGGALGADPGPTVEARVLADCEHGKPNDVVTLEADVARAAEKAGHVDTNEAAVAYAKTLKGA